MRLFSSRCWTGRWQVSARRWVVSVMIASTQLLAQTHTREHPVEHPTLYRRTQVDGLSIVYREAGPKDGRPFSCSMDFPLPRGCSSLSWPGFPIAITLSRLTTPASDTATARTRKNSLIRSITSPRS